MILFSRLHFKFIHFPFKIQYSSTKVYLEIRLLKILTHLTVSLSLTHTHARQGSKQTYTFLLKIVVILPSYAYSLTGDSSNICLPSLTFRNNPLEMAPDCRACWCTIVQCNPWVFAGCCVAVHRLHTREDSAHRLHWPPFWHTICELIERKHVKDLSRLVYVGRVGIDQPIAELVLELK